MKLPAKTLRTVKWFTYKGFSLKLFYNILIIFDVPKRWDANVLILYDWKVTLTITKYGLSSIFSRQYVAYWHGFLKYVVDIWLYQSIMNTVSLVNFISFHYWLSSVSSYFNLELFFMLSSPHLCNLSTEYYTKESQYFGNKHITAHYSMENALYSLVRFLILLNLWIKTLRSHIPWSNLYI